MSKIIPLVPVDTGTAYGRPAPTYRADLTEVVVSSGHWMAQEQPVAVNAALAKWLAAKLPDYWKA